MGLTIVAIAGFQVYWLGKTYEREERGLEMRTNTLFRETVRTLQAAKLKLDRFPQDAAPDRLLLRGELDGHRHRQHNRLSGDRVDNILDVVMQRTGDSLRPRVVIRSLDSLRGPDPRMSPRQNRIMQFLFDVDSLQDSIRVKEIDTAYHRKLTEGGLDVPFRISRVETKETGRPAYNEVTLGFAAPITYRLDLQGTSGYVLLRILPAILFSFFLVGFTILSFSLLYRNLLRQRRLAAIKNEFISNITHELKTPIATVSVAIEALRNFNASLNPQKTQEYLDISANELQRLSLLVDKVLKLSMFENKEIELKYEPVDLRQLADEVASSMRLQFEKRKAVVNVQSSGNAGLEGDRLHLLSVLFNLLDNALKYTTAAPRINVSVAGVGTEVELTIADNGIGIPPEYQGRIFEKFFRVPHGNLHNAKGYGLGLSYVSHVVEQHGGSLKVQSAEGRGTTFLIALPRRKS